MLRWLFYAGLVDVITIDGSLSIFYIDLIPCAYKIKCIGEYNKFSLFHVILYVNNNIV